MPNVARNLDRDAVQNRAVSSSLAQSANLKIVFIQKLIGCPKGFTFHYCPRPQMRPHEPLLLYPCKDVQSPFEASQPTAMSS